VSDCKNVVAVKEASGSMDQSSEILSLCDVTILSGDDSATLPLMALGAKGVISVVSNVVPTETQRMVSCFLDGDVEAARKLHYRLFPLSKSMFIETNPIPVKTAMKLMGLINGEMRLPLSPLRDANLPRLEKALKDFGVAIAE